MPGYAAPYAPGPSLAGPTSLGGPGPKPDGRRRPSVTTVLGSLVVVLVLLGASLLVVGSSGGSGDAHAQLTSAVTNTLGDKTAHVVLTGTVGVAGQSMHISATGAMDFTQNAVQLTMHVTNPGPSPVSATEQAIYVGGTEYLKIGTLPTAGTGATGKPWVAINLSALQGAQGSSVAGGGANPAAFLQLLQEQGATVTPLGASTIGATAVQGYRVTFSTAAIKKQLATQKLPAWARQITSMISGSGLKYTVYVDGSNRLRQATVSMHETLGTTTISVQETLDLSDYGAPVTITPPPANQVKTLGQSLPGGLGGGGGTTTS